jgi:ClpP class serine protease
MLGSIGVYATLYDTEEAEKKYGYKSISIYSDESPEKNLGHREALKGNEKPMKEHLNKVAQLFISDIKGKRPNIDGKATKGAMYLAKESIELGLGDEMGDLSKAIAYINNEQNKFYI